MPSAENRWLDFYRSKSGRRNSLSSGDQVALRWGPPTLRHRQYRHGTNRASRSQCQRNEPLFLLSLLLAALIYPVRSLRKVRAFDACGRTGRIRESIYLAGGAETRRWDHAFGNSGLMHLVEIMLRIATRGRVLKPWGYLLASGPVGYLIG